MARILVAYLATAVAMAVLDVGWLRYAEKAFFQPAVGSLLAHHTNNVAAVLFYVLYVAGIVLFTLGPGMRNGWWAATLYGAAFGFFAYMTYDLTNMATLKVWPAYLAAIDIGWGTFVTAVAATAGYLAASRIA
jgi:uncharacterized membrane protein